MLSVYDLHKELQGSLSQWPEVKEQEVEDRVYHINEPSRASEVPLSLYSGEVAYKGRNPNGIYAYLSQLYKASLAQVMTFPSAPLVW
jgi:hypothetical protein